MTKTNQKIPEGWSVKKLIDICPLQRGFDLPEQDIVAGDYPIVYSNGVKGTHNTYKAKAPGVVTGRSGTIGKVTYVTKDYWPHNTSLWVTDFKGNSPKFIFYKIQNLKFSKFDSGSGVPTLNRNDVHIERILLPPLCEQEKIAEILGTWDTAIEKLSALIEQKKRLKKGLMQRLLTGNIRFSKSTYPWKKIKLIEIGSTYTGLSGKNKDDFGKGAKFIPYMNIYQNNKIDLNFLENVEILPNETQNTVQYGDIFFTTSSETPEEVGFSSVLLTKINYPLYLNSFCFGFRLNDFNTLIPEYAVYLFRSKQVKKIMYKLAQGATRFNLSKNELMKQKIYIPTDISEQRAIADILSKADEEITLLTRKLSALKTQKTGLMQKLLTGQIRVKVA
ncbi:MAG: restriction endonuclease subunit S [Alphaproteobacteria bacterium]|nr:restriction endonuclease subunit S [Alphaproteobacteria bacterium]